MTKSCKVVLELLHKAFDPEYNCQIPVDCNWTDVIEIASCQGILGVCFEAVECLDPDQRPDIDNLMEWLGQVEYQVALFDAQLQSAKKLAAIWHDQGIRTLVLKGFTLAANYPVKNHRPSSDMDCYVIGGDVDSGETAWEKADRIVSEMGIDVYRKDYRHSTFQFHNVHVENHKICTTVRGKTKRKDFERYLRKLLNGQPTKRIGDSWLEIPCERFNALFFLQHSHRHFLREGITLRYVCDWAMILKKYNCFDEGFWSICERHDLKPFADSLTRIAWFVCGVKNPWLKEDHFLLKQDRMLINDCFKIADQAIQYGNDIKAHFQMAKNMVQHGWKYKYFSEDFILLDIIISAWAVKFEKNPEI